MDRIKKEKKGAGQKHGRPTSRAAAVACLSRWAQENRAIGPFIDELVYRSPLAPVDRHLAVQLVNGVLRRMQYLDSLLAGFSTHPLDKMKSLTIMTLRVGVYQIMCLDRVPDSAAVNETVNVLKSMHQPSWMLSFVNGILRNIVRSKKSLPGPDNVERDDSSLLNHPRWLVQRWIKRYGREKTWEICRLNNQEPLLVLRVNTGRIATDQLMERLTEKGYTVKPGRYVPDSLVLLSFAGPLNGLPGFEEGMFHVQDEAAQLVSFLMGPFEAVRYLDCCAGLGGKTCHLAQLIPDQAGLVAVEPSRHRVQRLEENAARLHVKGVSIFHGSLEDFAKTSPGRFSRILVDAPCSGTGVTGRHPDIRWNRKEVDLERYQKKQLTLLKQAAGMVEPGGVLVYATCSMEPEENSQVVDSFLAAENSFSSSDTRFFLPAEACSLVDSRGFLVTTPADGLDGFFGARLERKQ